MNIAFEPIIMIIPFLLTGVWVVLYRSRTVRVDIYHHSAPETLRFVQSVLPAHLRSSDVDSSEVKR